MRFNNGLGCDLSFATLALSALPLSASFTVPSLWSRDSVSASRGLQKRADKVEIPAPLSIGPSQYWDGIDGPWSSFAIQVGTPAQNVRVMMSTAGYVTWVIQPKGCLSEFGADCEDNRGFFFKLNESLTWVPNSQFPLMIEDNLGLDSSGDTGFDTITLGWQGSPDTPNVTHSTITALEDDKSEYWLGEFGLNPRPANFTTFTDPQPSFLHQLVAQNKTPSLTYGYTAGNKYRLNSVYGSLTLGGFDQNRFTPTDVTFPFGDDISRDLLVNLQSITSDKSVASEKGAPFNLLPGGTIPIFLDTTIPYLYLPKKACQAFEDAFGIEWDSDQGFYLVNDTQHRALQNQKASVTFTLSNSTDGGSTVDIVMPYAAFDLNIDYPAVVNSSKYFPLKRADNDTQFTLGRAFFQEAYLIADYDRQNFTVAPCTWDQKKVNNADIQSILSPTLAQQVHHAQKSASSGISAGAIAGIVIGIVAVIAIIGGLVWFFRRRKNADKKRVAELEAKEAGGMGKEQEDGSPVISHPIGGELDNDGQIHELNSTAKTPAQELASPFNPQDPSKHGFSEMDGGEATGTGKGWAQEMDAQGEQPIYEMPGSDVTEMPGSHGRLPFNSGDVKQPSNPPQPPTMGEK